MKTSRPFSVLLLSAMFISLVSTAQVSVQFPTITGGYGAYTLTQSGNMTYGSSVGLYTSANLGSYWGYITSIKWKGYGSINYNLVQVNAYLANTTDAFIATGKTESYYRTTAGTVSNAVQIANNASIALTTSAAWVGFTGLSYLLSSGQNLYVTFHCNASTDNYAYFAGTGTPNCGSWGSMSNNTNPSITVPAANGGLRPDIMVIYGLPTISVPSTATMACSGSTNIAVTASTLSTSYQWQYAATPGGPYTNVANGTPSGAVYGNATTNTLAISGINISGDYYYKCVAFNGNATSTTSSAYTTLNVGTCCTAPTNVVLAGFTTPVCSGSDPGTFTATANGGNGGTYTYLWYKDGISTGITTQTYTPGALTANTDIYCAVSTGTGCATNSPVETVSVHTLPPVSIGAFPQAYCNGQSSTLTASGANNYTWSPATGLSDTIGTIVTAGPTSTITYTVTGTDDNNCSNTFTSTITVYTIPDPPTVNVVNNCGSSTLTASDYTGTLLWSTAENSFSITVTAAGSYTVTQSENGCTSAPAGGTAAPESFPVVYLGSDVTICPDQSVILDAGNPGASYIWTPGGQTTQTKTVDSLGLGLGSHAISVIVTSPNLCSDTDVVVVTIDACSGIKPNNDEISLTATPNPSDGNFYLTINGLEEAGTLNIYNPESQMVLTEKIDFAGMIHKTVDMRAYPKGIYFVRISTSKYSHIEKIVID